MPEQSHPPTGVRTDEVTHDQARGNLERNLEGLFEPIRVSVAPFAGFVLALMLGRRLTGGSAVQIDELVFGLPLAWLVGWIGTRKWELAWIAAGLLLAVIALTIGLVDPG